MVTRRTPIGHVVSRVGKKYSVILAYRIRYIEEERKKLYFKYNNRRYAASLRTDRAIVTIIIFIFFYNITETI